MNKIFLHIFNFKYITSFIIIFIKQFRALNVLKKLNCNISLLFASVHLTPNLQIIHALCKNNYIIIIYKLLFYLYIYFKYEKLIQLY